MKNESWLSKLTPWDSELLLMVESLTGVCPDIKNGGTHYFFEVDYSKHHNPEYINAVMDAIAGRLGNRLIKITDDPDAERLIVRAHFAKKLMKKIVHSRKTLRETDLSQGFQYGSIQAIQVTKENYERLMYFVGNGEMVEDENGYVTFCFLNAQKSVFADAPQGYYIVYISPGLYRVLSPAEFANMVSGDGKE